MPYLLPAISVHVVRELLAEHGVPTDEPLLHAFTCTRLRPGGGARARNDGTLFVTERHLCFVQRRTLLTPHRARVFDLREVGLLKLGLGADAALSIATARKPKAYQFGRFGGDGRDAAFDAVRAQAKALGARWPAFAPAAQRASGRDGDATPTDTLSNSSSGGLAPARPIGARAGAGRGGGAARADAFAPLDDKLAAGDERRGGAGRCGRIARACIRHPHHVVERTVSLFFEKIGGAVADAPRLSIALGLVVALLCSTGLLAAKFETSSHKLYIPQRSELAGQRALLSAEFGESPEVSLLVVSRKDGGDLATADSMLALHALHARIGAVEAPDGAGGLASYASVCARRYVAMLGETVCIVSSPLELWAYSKAALSKDADVRATISEAVAGGKFDLGGVELLPPAPTDASAPAAPDARAVAADAPAPPPPPARYSALATQHVLYYNTTLPAFRNGSQLAFERGLRALLEAQNALDASEQPLRTSYWSSPFNEEEAQSFVSKDSFLMALSILFILVYVCLTLGGATCDPRRSRIGLGLSCALCTALAMSSGFGLASMLGVPLQPISPIVCFTLLGVSVDDMIIIVFSFDQTDPARPLRERLAASMAVSGTMVTVTSFTSFCAFLTGSHVDFPAYAYFCVPAAFCILAVYFLQLTVFAGLLALDAERVARLEARLAAAEGLPTLAPGALARALTTSEPRVRPLEELMRRHHARTLLRPSVRALVIAVWFACVLAAGASLRNLRVGLDVRATLPDHSPILEFVDDVDQFWAGSTNPAHILVVRGMNASSASELARVRAALGSLRALPFVHSVRSDWLTAFETYRGCKGEPAAGLGTKAAMRAFLSDGGVHDCAPPEAAAAEARRRLAPRPHAPVPALSPNASAPIAAPTVAPAPPAETVALSAAGGAAAAAAADPAAAAPGAIDEPEELSAHEELTESVDAAAAQPSHSLLELLQRAISDSMSTAAMTVAKGSGPKSLMQGGMDFEQDVVLGSDDSEIIDAFRIVFNAEMPSGMRQAWANYETMRATLAGYDDIDAHVYQFKYEFALADVVMPRFGLANLLQAAAAICVCLCLFLPPTIALLCTLTVGCIDVLLLGLMVFLDLPLNTITLVSLLLALALAIDYSCHIGHAYATAPGRTRADKVTSALDSIGYSIFNAGGSTLLGTLFLAASQSPIFRTFFVLIWGAIFLGLVAGLALMPALLSLVGPLPHSHSRPALRARPSLAHRLSSADQLDDDLSDGAPGYGFELGAGSQKPARLAMSLAGVVAQDDDDGKAAPTSRGRRLPGATWAWRPCGARPPARLL